MMHIVLPVGVQASLFAPKDVSCCVINNEEAKIENNRYLPLTMGVHNIEFTLASR
jgi:hypothetical protein